MSLLNVINEVIDLTENIPAVKQLVFNWVQAYLNFTRGSVLAYVSICNYVIFSLYKYT